MSTATDTSVTISIDPNSTSKQSDVIGPATPKKAGAMSAAQAAKLAGQGPSPFEEKSTLIYKGTAVPTNAGGFGFKRDAAYIGGVRISATANDGKDYAIGIFPFLALRVSGVITQFFSTLQTASSMNPSVSTPNGMNPMSPGNNNGGGGIFGIATPAFDNLGVNVQTLISGSDVQFVVTGAGVNFRFDGYWAQTPDDNP
jgi:hypothetical protein